LKSLRKHWTGYALLPQAMRSRYPRNGGILSVRHIASSLCGSFGHISVAGEVPTKTRLLLLFCILLAGCHRDNAVRPVVRFTRVPTAGFGGPEKLETVEGEAEGALKDQQIVLYAKSEVWWVQPFKKKSRTSISPSGHWSNQTHLGSQYAALLVAPTYHAPLQTDGLPPIGNGVYAVAIATGSGGSSSKQDAVSTVRFSNYDWQIRTSESDRGGFSHRFSALNVHTDASGYLHMKIAGQPNHWTCSEVKLGRSLGYGTYSIRVQRVSSLPPATSFSMFTWSDLSGDQNHREMDIDLSRWGDPDDKNAQYALQPYYVAANVYRFNAPPETLTYQFRWSPGKVEFTTLRQEQGNHYQPAVSRHIFDSGVPSPSDESLHLTFCPFQFSRVPLQHEAEIVLENFQYLP
jgi:hypothetical protein